MGSGGTRARRVDGVRRPDRGRAASGRARAGALVVGAVLAVVALAALTSLPAGAQDPPPTDPTSTTTSTSTSTSTTTSTLPVDSSTTTSTTAPEGPPGSETTTTEADTTTTAPEAPPVTVDLEANPDLAELPPGELALITKYLSAKAEARDLSDRIAAMNDGIVDVQNQLTAAQGRVHDAEARAAEAERRADAVQVRLDEQRLRLQRHAVEAYIAGNDDGDAVSALLHAGSIDDVGASMAYADAIVADEQGMVRRTGALRDQVAAAEADAAAESDAAQAARDEVAARDTELNRKRDELITTQQLLVVNAERQRSVMSEAAQRRVAVAEQLETQARLSDGIAGTLAARQAGQALPADIDGIFLSPIPNPKISSPFGARADPLFGTISGHPGIDIVAPTGTSIRAPADGVVVASGWVDGYGNCTVIDHGNGLATLYGHQSATLVADGMPVVRGQTIGLVGSTGYSTGPHLHWEVRVFGKVVNPVPYIGQTT